MRDNIVKYLSKLVSIESSYPRENEIFLQLRDILNKSQFIVETQIVEGSRYNIFAEKNKTDDKNAVLFYGHMDTVPLVNEDEWKTNPLKLSLKSGRLYGLGASDMKGGIAAFLEATKDTAAYCKIFLAVDEENISEGAWKAFAERKQFFEDVELIISAEPSFGLGLNGITVGRTGRCIFEVTFQGKPEHIIKYKQAVDAIEKFSEFAHNLYKNRETLFKSPDTVIQIRKVEGESKGMSVCGSVYAEIEAILGSEDKVQDVLLKLQSLTNDLIRLKKRKTPYLEGYKFNSFPYEKEIATIVKRHTGKKMSLHTRKSVGDDNVLAKLGIPVITWGPVGGNEHAPNEYVELESLRSLSNMYKKIIKIER